MYSEQIEFTLVCKPILPTNYRPAISRDATAAWDRLCLTAFPVRFVDNPSAPHERKADNKFVEQCLGEYLDEMFSWMVRGAVAWYANPDLTEPASMRAHIDSYKDEMDSVGRFIRECCESDGSAQASEIYEDYKHWSDKPVNITEFGREMSKQFAKKHCESTLQLGLLRFFKHGIRHRYLVEILADLDTRRESAISRNPLLCEGKVLGFLLVGHFVCRYGNVRGREMSYHGFHEFRHWDSINRFK